MILSVLGSLCIFGVLIGDRRGFLVGDRVGVLREDSVDFLKPYPNESGCLIAGDLENRDRTFDVRFDDVRSLDLVTDPRRRKSVRNALFCGLRMGSDTVVG